MADDSSQDKQLAASERKLSKAREDGQVVRSKDLGHFFVILAAVGVLTAMTPVWMDHLQQQLNAGMRFDARTVANPDMMLDRLAQWSNQAMWMVVPFGAGLALASVVAGGWVMTFKVVFPDFGKLNPITGFGKLFAKQQIVDALKASALGLILGATGVFFLIKVWPTLVGLLAQPLPTTKVVPSCSRPR
ncbi:MAG: EscU/YscU/HrcU family type III secretion system export apparatus switch protein [Pseudomonadota bacterium]